MNYEKQDVNYPVRRVNRHVQCLSEEHEML